MGHVLEKPAYIGFKACPIGSIAMGRCPTTNNYFKEESFMFIYNMKRNLLPEGQVDHMKVIDYLYRENVKTKSGYQDRIQIHFAGSDGTSLIQNYNASLLSGSHFGQFLRKLFGEEEDYGAFDLDRLKGIYCKLTIVHSADAGGNVFANVADIEQSSAPLTLNIFDDDEEVEETESEQDPDAESIISE
jgi:hypothetical protein